MSSASMRPKIGFAGAFVPVVQVQAEYMIIEYLNT